MQIRVLIEPVENNGQNPWVEFAGMFRDDPLYDDWIKSIAEYRQKVDSDPNYL